MQHYITQSLLLGLAFIAEQCASFGRNANYLEKMRDKIKLKWMFEARSCPLPPFGKLNAEK